jgi:antitoxin PrlF
MKAVVAERGQVTIPKILRQKLGIKPGTILDLHIQKTTLIAVKFSQQDVIEKVYGCLKLKHSINTNKIIDDLRGRT